MHRLLAVHGLKGSSAAQSQTTIREVPLLSVEAKAQAGGNAALVIWHRMVLHEVVLRRLWEKEDKEEEVVMM